MKKCSQCGGPMFGRGKCIICRKTFILRKPDQITCASAKCKVQRNLDTQKIWKKKNAGNLG